MDSEKLEEFLAIEDHSSGAGGEGGGGEGGDLEQDNQDASMDPYFDIENSAAISPKRRKLRKRYSM